ncbi:hypothetical protein HK103_006588 [Boothiomyces macroporosus]|uniref:UspA domain-containing protein n=1 Tax=Boothiomyces macroporosus TaxID=261099 RepID=A0AAD5Y2G9_9FUNG|nr:hypothetical protein HK103_002590 [Boothiomyces macroporosus]KAJ3255125.1 hypothetical protein HK103_006588 [Boothiomyces macroporosus]
MRRSIPDLNELREYNQKVLHELSLTEFKEQVIEQATDFTPKRIVFLPVDGSVYTEKVVDWALNNVLKTSDLVILFNVFASPYNATGGPKTTAKYQDTVEHVHTEFRQKAVDLIVKLGNVLNSNGIRVKGVVASGSPKKLIDEQIENEHPDVVIIGRRGLGQIQQMFMGSISNHLIHSTKVPIILVP